MPSVAIRPPSERELPGLRDIERAAGAAFRGVGMGAVADDEPPSLAELEAFRAAGRAWVAVGPAGQPLAYLTALELDGGAHVAQVSVHPAHARLGIGAQLIEHLALDSARRGATQLTLTAFRDVPWNAPYYARLGFEVLAAEQRGPLLARLVAAETRALPSAAPRVAMARAFDFAWPTRQDGPLRGGRPELP